MSKAAALWKSLVDKRYAWAFKAYDDFMKELPDEVCERIGHKSVDREAYVVVFGKPQVGKTTLLLDLMGVAPEHLPLVTKVLRGGRDAGRSATATALEYRRSASRHWGLQIEGGLRWFHSDSDMTEELGELRSLMERQELQVHSPCVIFLPDWCFPPGENQLQVRMLDLPGDQPSNQAEHEHVGKMAKQYIPLADLILLVGRSDDLTFLQPGRLALPGIRNWQCMPHRFRVVTTFSFEPKDVRDAMRANAAPDARAVRDSLIYEVERAGRLLPQARNPEWFFPLEFGESWKVGLEQERALYERVAPIITELKQALLQQIRDATGPWARLRNATFAHSITLQLMHEGFERYFIELKATRMASAEARRSFKEVERARNYAKSEASRLGQSIPNEHWIERNIRFDFPDDPAATPTTKSCKEIVGLIAEAASQFSTWPAKLRPNAASEKWSRFFQGIQQPNVDCVTHQINELVEQEFRALRRKLDKYMFDRYWLNDNWKADSSAFIAQRQKCRNSAEELIKNAWLDAALSQRQLIEHEAESFESRASIYKNLLDELRDKRIAHHRHFCKIRGQFATFRLEMEPVVASSRRFLQILDERYLEELHGHRSAALSGVDPAARALHLLAAVKLIEDRAALLLRMDGTTPDPVCGQINQQFAS